MKAIDVFSHGFDLRNHFFPAYRTLTPEQIEWKPEGGKNNIAFLLRHVAQSEDWFIRAVIRQEQMTPKRKAELPTLETIMDYLEETRNRTLDLLREIPVEALNETRPMPEGFRGSPRSEVTVGWVIHRIQSHEAYHLGQINMLMRLQGLEPPNM